MTKKVQHFLSLDKTQRIIYLLAIPLWTYLWWIDDLTKYSSKAIDIIWAVPVIFLLVQVLLNSKTIWRVVFAAISFYTLSVTIGASQHFISTNEFTFKSLIEFTIPITFLAFTTYIIYRIKPIQSQTSTLRAIIEL